MRPLIYAALLSSVLAITSSPYWLTTPHIQTFSYLLLNSLSAPSGQLTPITYSPTLNRTYTTTPNIVLSCSGLTAYYGYYYHLHYLSVSSVSASSVTLRLNVTYYAYSFKANVMLFTS